MTTFNKHVVFVFAEQENTIYVPAIIHALPLGRHSKILTNRSYLETNEEHGVGITIEGYIEEGWEVAPLSVLLAYSDSYDTAKNDETRAAVVDDFMEYLTAFKK